MILKEDKSWKVATKKRIIWLRIHHIQKVKNNWDDNLIAAIIITIVTYGEILGGGKLGRVWAKSVHCWMKSIASLNLLLIKFK